MELDPVKLLCSDNPLEALVASLKQQLADAISAAGGKINGAILSIQTQLKDALSTLIPPLSPQSSFLIELNALKEKLSGPVDEFLTASKNLIEKWGKIVTNIEQLIAQLDDLSICDLMDLNFKMNPDGSYILASAPPKTVDSVPVKPVAAEITTTSNLPDSFTSKISASANAGKSIQDTMQKSQLYQTRVEITTAFNELKASDSFKNFAQKAQAQGGLSLDNTDIKNLNESETQIQQDFIIGSQSLEQVNNGWSVCLSSAQRVDEKLLQLIRQNRGSIASEDVESILNSLSEEIKYSTDKNITDPRIIDAVESLSNDLKLTLTAKWKDRANRAAMQSGISEVKVIEGQKFAEWFNSQGFKHFSPQEFTSYFSRPLNSAPSSSLWANIVPTLRIVDELCDILGTKVRITSSYRSQAYNRSIGGATNSFHSKFQALDIQASNKSSREIYSILKSWRNQGKFNGGLGLYNTFVHIDTRGYNTNW